MRVLHVPGSALPFTTGGKEVFVHYLVKNLNRLGITNLIAVHKNGKIKEQSTGLLEFDKVQLNILPQIPNTNDQQYYYSREVRECPGFEELVMSYEPHLVHFHDHSGGASLTHFRLIKKLGIKTVITYHTPGQSCPQHQLLYQGEKLCDGELLEYRCTECQLKYFGVPKPFNYLFAMKSAGEFGWAGNKHLQKAAFHSKLTKDFITSFREFYEGADAVHISAEWVKDLLLKNKILPDKIHKIRQGSYRMRNIKNIKELNIDGNIKIVFIGRCSYVKGIHILINAVKKLKSNAPIEIFFFGPYWNKKKYGKELLSEIENDRRFHMPEFVPNELLQNRLMDMDICVIPSVWLETGPLTIYDAWDAGLPVIGSDAGGLRELLHNGGGITFRYGDAGDLAELLKKIMDRDQSVIQRLKPPDNFRTFHEMASDFSRLYQEVYD